MKTINRMVVTIIPRQPYIDWANGFDDGGPKMDAPAKGGAFCQYVGLSRAINAVTARPIALGFDPYIFEAEIKILEKEIVAMPGA
jgi:hypothetical protein